MTTIVSKNNPAVKSFAALKEKKARRERGAFLVEGAKMVRECAESGLKILRIAIREDYAGELFGLQPIVLGEDAFKAVCDEKTPQGIVAEAEIPKRALRAPKGSCLLLDGVSDPANVGAIVRTAVAAGYPEIYCISCADPYSPKSVRASMSGVFFANVMSGTREEVLSCLAGVPLIAADMAGENAFTFQPPEKFALCIGNEGNGLSEEVFAAAAQTVKIPMNERTESLNASVSAGILMYLLKK
ncbi:MAG: RNA methyltransferase, partial [Clostridia bacterium]|nr:RNA methyltransferase [Clostridia bacterium]